MSGRRLLREERGVGDEHGLCAAEMGIAVQNTSAGGQVSKG